MGGVERGKDEETERERNVGGGEIVREGMRMGKVCERERDRERGC